MDNSIRINYKEVRDALSSILKNHGFTGEKADICAGLFAETSLDGVYSHGLNRFPLFMENLQKGFIKPDREPSLLKSLNNFERWDGNLGPGNLNARFCMDRAVRLAKENGTGIVSLRNTNHWLRGGSYGIQAARENCIGICMTNTIPNMPPWGGREPGIGNNPLIICVPDEPYPVLLDMALSQYSFGKIEMFEEKGEKLPLPGGFDPGMKPSTDPSLLLQSQLGLPIGYWKGSGLSILIDLLISILSEGNTSSEIGSLGTEYALSQLFIAFDLEQLTSESSRKRIVRLVLESVTGCKPVQEGDPVKYPGQQTWNRRQENERSGIPVSKNTWEAIQQLSQTTP